MAHPRTSLTWLIRSPRVALGLFAAGIGLVVIGVVWPTTLRSMARMEMVAERLESTGRIQAVRMRLQRSLLNEVRGLIPGNSFIVEDLRLQVEQALTLGRYLDPRTADRLAQLRDLLSHSPLVPREALLGGLDLIALIHDAEVGAQAQLLAEVQHDARKELNLTIGALIAIAGLGLIALVLFRARLVTSLAELQTLLTRLAAGEFRTIPVDGTDPVLVPVFEHFNYLVDRLAVLEAEHRQKAETLENEIRKATRALLEQHRTLAAAERLAAVGETAAGVAHELRNPLAGIQIALDNLERETQGTPTATRLQPVVGEVQRITRLLNGYLSAARHTPEPASTINLHKLVDDLLSLLQYQAAPNVKLEAQIEADLECRLPPDRVRQMLLNLILNSVQALGSSGGTVTVTAGRTDGDVVLAVEDDGPGFPAPVLESEGRDRFVTNRESGTGLGLAMVRRVVDDLGGSLMFSNLETGGASVRVRVACGHE